MSGDQRQSCVGSQLVNDGGVGPVGTPERVRLTYVVVVSKDRSLTIGRLAEAKETWGGDGRDH